MDHLAVAAALRIADPAQIAPRWDEARSALPAGDQALPADAVLRTWRAELKLDPACDEPVARVAAQVRSDPALAALAWYLHWRIFLAPGAGGPSAVPLEARLGHDAGSFWLLIALGFAPAIAAQHRARGYPSDVTAATLTQVEGYVDNHRRGEGRVGCYPGQVCWLRTYMDFPYVRLGRLAFQVMPFGAQFVAFRRRLDGAVLALARDGLRIDMAGLAARSGEEPAWTARVVADGAGVAGSPVDPAGIVQRRTVRLDRSEWEPFLAAGDPILSIHIPPGGAMDLPAVQDSFRQARAFFARHHPEAAPRALWCGTWFLDPRLAELMPPTANPLRVQRCLYLHPIEPWGDGGLWFVFLKPTADIAALPRDTSVQRALADFLASGRRWNGGGGFIPLDEAGGLAEGRYRDRFAGVCPG